MERKQLFQMWKTSLVQHLMVMYELQTIYTIK